MVLSQVKYLPFFWTTSIDLKSCLVSVGPRTDCPAVLFLLFAVPENHALLDWEGVC